MVMSLFSRLSRQMLRGIRVSLVGELETRINRWSKELNEKPTPIRWAFGMDDIDMDMEDLASIGYQVVSTEACHP